jgi:hypothetical protein
MKTIKFISAMAIIIALFSVTNNAQAQPANYKIGKQEFVTLSEQALSHVIKFDFDAWAGMLADDVEFWFPDGDNSTRTKLIGKKAVIDWWKNWKATSGIKSMTMDEAVFLPVNALKPTAGSKLTGNIVINYFTNKLDFATGTANLRMNFVTHFNANKKIDRYITTYDRSVIIKAMGVDILQKK